MANYPEKPTRVSGYTEKWVNAFLEEKATSTQIRKFRKACEGLEAWKDKRAVFVEMFINKKEAGTKKPKKTFDDKLLELEQKKRAAEKAAKAQAQADN